MNTPRKGFSYTPERREFGRRKTFLHARISVRGRPSIPCVVRDLSAAGARVEFALPSWFPSRFRLVIEATRFEADCEIMHRSDDAVGVRFATARANRT